jgi:hypothetical protein
MRFIVLILFSLIGLGSAQAQVAWTLETQVWSQYLAGDTGQLLYKGPGAQSSITASFANGCFINLWDWRAFGRSEQGNYSEADYTVGCAIPLEQGVNLNLGLAYFDLPRQFSSLGDIVEAQIGLSKTSVVGSHAITLSVMAKPVHVLGRFADGMWTEAGVVDVITIDPNLSLSLGARVLYDTGIYGATPGWNARFDAIGIVHVAEGIDWKLGVRAFEPLTKFDNPLDRRRPEVAFWTGLSRSFTTP